MMFVCKVSSGGIALCRSIAGVSTSSLTESRRRPQHGTDSATKRKGQRKKMRWWSRCRVHWIRDFFRDALTRQLAADRFSLGVFEASPASDDEPLFWKLHSSRHESRTQHYRQYGRGRQGPIPKARLVAFGWLVCATSQLESQYRSGRPRHLRYHSSSVETQCREGSEIQDAGEGYVLSKQKVSRVAAGQGP